MKKNFLLVAAILLSQTSFADTPDLNLLTQSQADAIAEEFSTNFAHSPVSGAATLGDIFGIEVGVILGLTSTPKIDQASKETDPNVSISAIPHAGAYAALSLPFGITGELTYVPEVGTDVKFDHLSYGFKYTLPNSLNIPFDGH